MSFYDDFPAYVPVAEKKAAAIRAVEKLKKKNKDIRPVIIEGRKLAKTWWGKSWNDNLESYADFSNRISRGRSYVRHRAVLDLKITSGEVTALVKGSSAKPYEVDISISPISTELWEGIVKKCKGKIESLEELTEGKFPKALSNLFTSRGKGVFPSSKQINFSCSCPDGAYMCKHIAAVLYGIGARLDEDPTLFFVLRNVNIEELISEAIKEKSETMLNKSKTKTRRVIEDDDISDMFGIDVK